MKTLKLTLIALFTAIISACSGGITGDYTASYEKYGETKTVDISLAESQLTINTTTLIGELKEVGENTWEFHKGAYIYKFQKLDNGMTYKGPTGPEMTLTEK